MLWRARSSGVFWMGRYSSGLKKALLATALWPLSGGWKAQAAAAVSTAQHAANTLEWRMRFSSTGGPRGTGPRWLRSVEPAHALLTVKTKVNTRNSQRDARTRI